MRTTPRLLLTALLAVSVALFAAGCAKKAKEAPPTPPTPPPTSQSTNPAPSTSSTPSSESSTGSEIGSGVFTDAFFDFDSYSLRADAKLALDKDAKYLRENKDVKVTVEGHCDERGTVEYNQALGEKRANAARDYLVAAGVTSARLQVVSYGKERPFAEGHDESAWSQNRRARLVLR